VPVPEPEEDHSAAGSKQRFGPRGGRTTHKSSGLVKKCIWLEGDVEAALRQEAFEAHVSESEIVRQALRERYGLE
jgi:hypothetical protein